MRGGSVVALVGSLLAFWGPLLLPFVTLEEEQAAVAVWQTLPGLLSIALSLTAGALAVAVLRKRSRSLGSAVAMVALAQVGLMVWMYVDVWALVPCPPGAPICDRDTGALVAQSLVTLDWGLVAVVVGALVAVVGGLLVVGAHPEYGPDARFLRVALTWQGQVVHERVLFRRAPLTVGERDDATFQVAAWGLESQTVFRPDAGEGWSLRVPGGLTGRLRAADGELALVQGDEVTLGREHSGVLNLENDLALRFDFTSAETALLSGTSALEGAGLSLSLAIVASVVLVFLTTALLGEKDRRRVAVDEGVASKHTSLIVVDVDALLPPEPEEEIEGVEDALTGKQASGDEGVLGDPEKAPELKSKVPNRPGKFVDRIDVRQLGVAKVLGGVAAMDGALSTIMAGDTGELHSKMAVAMSGEGDELVIGHGAGGMGFRGTGTGGGGEGGYGRIHGLGPIDTGGGPGRYANKGRVALGPKRRRKVDTIVTSVSSRVAGFCERGDLTSKVKGRAAGIRACYEMQLMAQPDLRGSLKALWTIDESGTVRDLKFVASTLDNHAVQDCVLRRLRNVRFKPPTDGICVVQWGFAFAPAS